MMVMGIRCESCGKEFDHDESLEQHKAAKHSAGAQPASTIGYGKGNRLKYGLIIIVIIGVIGGGFFVLSGNNQDSITGQAISEQTKTGSVDYALSWYNSKGQLHWHPELTIKIDGQTQTIPQDTGITPYKHYPVHTHEANNVLHWEIFPPEKPSQNNMRLGYFFQIWGKKFNKDCILNNCNDGTKSVKFFVNGQPNTEFENYLVHDGDKLEIEYS